MLRPIKPYARFGRSKARRFYASLEESNTLREKIKLFRQMHPGDTRFSHKKLAEFSGYTAISLGRSLRPGNNKNRLRRDLLEKLKYLLTQPTQN